VRRAISEIVGTPPIGRVSARPFVSLYSLTTPDTISSGSADASRFVTDIRVIAKSTRAF